MAEENIIPAMLATARRWHPVLWRMSQAAYVRRRLGMAEPPARGGAGRGQGRKRKPVEAAEAVQAC